jgi:CheY-like chemotaxis protein
MSKKILIVDDDKLVRQALADALARKGFTIELAADGREGLKKALENDVDLVLTDIRMPEMTGLEMVEEIRKDEEGKKLPVVILSVDEQTSTINQALQSGVTVYLSKATFDTDAEAIAEQITIALGQ